MKPTLTPEQLAKRRKINSITIIVTLSILLIIGLIVKGDKTIDAPKPYSEGLLKIRTERMAKNLITEKLKSPSTAKFGDVEYVHKGSDISMRGYVDAQNSFGAMLRNKWYVVINFTGTTEADLDSTNKYKLLVNELIQP